MHPPPKARWKATTRASQGTYKVLLHMTFGGVLSAVTGNNIATGALAAGINEAAQRELGKISDDELHKLASALLGGVASNSVHGAVTQERLRGKTLLTS